MEYRTLDDIKDVAQVVQSGLRKMSRRERLEYWARALEQMAQRPLQALRRLEFLAPHERNTVRDDNSPLSVAYNDPILRAEGLPGDRVGDAKQFFELTEEEAHYLLCDCHYSGTMTASMVASRVRSIAQRGAVHQGIAFC